MIPHRTYQARARRSTSLVLVLVAVVVAAVLAVLVATAALDVAGEVAPALEVVR